MKILHSYYFYPNFYKDNKVDYKGDFKPFVDHVWGQTNNLYEKI